MGVRVLNRRRVLVNAEYSPMQYQREYEAELRRKGSYWVIGQIDDIRDEMRGPFESRRDATKQMKALFAQYPTVVDDYGDKVERYLSVFQSKPSRNPGELGPWEFGSEDIPLQRQYAEEVDELNEQIARTHDLKRLARLYKKRAAVTEASMRGMQNPRRKSSIPEYVDPGTKMFLNDEWSNNVEVEVLEWNYGHSEKIGYEHLYDKALVRKIYFNKERVVHHYQLSFEPR